MRFRHRLIVAVVLAASGAAFGAPSAFAATAEVGSSSANFYAAPGEVNTVVVTAAPNYAFVISDSTSEITAGAGCVSSDVHTVTCYPDPDVAVEVDLFLGDMNDTLLAEATYGLVSADGGDGSDTLTSNEPATLGASLSGGNGSDTLTGSAARDALDGGAGRDIVRGGAGSDDLTGGTGADHVYGGIGNDGINENYSLKQILADTIAGGAGNDTIYGGNGPDAIAGGAGNDYIHGDAGADHIRGGDGADNIFGDTGADWLYGGAGFDRLNGGLGIDHCYVQTGGGTTNSC